MKRVNSKCSRIQLRANSAIYAYGGLKKALNLAKLATMRASLLLTSLSLCLTAAAHVTHLYRNIWTMANQRGGLPFTISDWFRPRYEPNVSLLLNDRETFRVVDTFFSFLDGWSHRCALGFLLVAPLGN